MPEYAKFRNRRKKIGNKLIELSHDVGIGTNYKVKMTQNGSVKAVKRSKALVTAEKHFKEMVEKHTPKKKG